MNILMFINDGKSIDRIIYTNLKKHVTVFTISKKKDSDFVINNDDSVSQKELVEFIDSKKITHFFYSENSSYIPLFLKDIPKKVKTVMFLIDTHINLKRRIPYLYLFDIIILVNAHQQKILSKHNPNLIPITYGADTDTFFNIPNTKKKYDVTFDGNIIPWIHYERLFMLGYLRLKRQAFFYSTDPYDRLNQVYNESKILLNKSPLKGWNMRIFEAVSSGTLLLTDRNEVTGIMDIFPDKKYFVYYSNYEDLYQKIQYYLSHDEEREAIAKRGAEYMKTHFSWYKQTEKMITSLKNHTYKKRNDDTYYIHMFMLHCYSFRNLKVARQMLTLAYENNEISFLEYIKHITFCHLYLGLSDVAISILNFIRFKIIVKYFQKSS